MGLKVHSRNDMQDALTRDMHPFQCWYSKAYYSEAFLDIFSTSCQEARGKGSIGHLQSRSAGVVHVCKILAARETAIVDEGTTKGSPCHSASRLFTNPKRVLVLVAHHSTGRCPSPNNNYT